MELSYRVQTCTNNRGSVFESDHSGVWSQQFEPELCNSRYCGWNHLAWFRLWLSRCRIDLCTCRHVTAPTWKPNAATTQDKHMTKTSKEANHGNINRDPSHNPSLYKIDHMPLTYVNMPYVNVTHMKIMKARQHPTVRDKLQKEAIAITSWSREPSMVSKLPFGKPSTRPRRWRLCIRTVAEPWLQHGHMNLIICDCALVVTILYPDDDLIYGLVKSMQDSLFSTTDPNLKDYSSSAGWWFQHVSTTLNRPEQYPATYFR